MKLSKKVLATMSAAALLVTAGLFTSCSDDDDDPNDMISGSGNNYSIDYTNETSETSRGLARSFFKHSGTAVKVTIQNPEKTNKQGGVMGVMFDFDEVTTEGVKTKAFDVVALRSAGATDGNIGYYVSRFENVTDIQFENFGAPTYNSDGSVKNPGNGAKETEYKEAFQTILGKYDTGKKETSVTVVALLEQATVAGTDSNNVNYVVNDFIYNVYLTTEDVKIDNNGKAKSADGSEFTLPTPVATIKTAYTELTQKKLCVYANVYGPGVLKGTWEYKGDYKQVALEEN